MGYLTEGMDRRRQEQQDYAKAVQRRLGRSVASKPKKSNYADQVEGMIRKRKESSYFGGM